jgi:hypothetical protein
MSAEEVEETVIPQLAAVTHSSSENSATIQNGFLKLNSKNGGIREARCSVIGTNKP